MPICQLFRSAKLVTNVGDCESVLFARWRRAGDQRRETDLPELIVAHGTSVRILADADLIRRLSTGEIRRGIVRPVDFDFVQGEGALAGDL